MTICRFYSNGYCRYGNGCRFEHIDARKDYYQKNYQRSDVRPPHSTGGQPQTNTSNRIGFSFNRTLESIDTNNANINRKQTFWPQMQSSAHPVVSQRQTDPHMPYMSPFARNVFQSSNTSTNANPRTGSFSFNRTLQQLSSNDGPTSRPLVDDIDMDSTAMPPMRANSGSRESQANPNSFGLFSQTNSNLFGNKSSIASKADPIVSPAVVASSDPVIKSSDDIYSKESDLSEKDLKAFESNSFAFKLIPISPPIQRICV